MCSIKRRNVPRNASAPLVLDLQESSVPEALSIFTSLPQSEPDSGALATMFRSWDSLPRARKPLFL